MMKRYTFNWTSLFVLCLIFGSFINIFYTQTKIGACVIFFLWGIMFGSWVEGWATKQRKKHPPKYGEYRVESRGDRLW